jgi:hypothetical protein
MLALNRIPSSEQVARPKLWFALDFNLCMLKLFCATRKFNSVNISRAHHHCLPQIKQQVQALFSSSLQELLIESSSEG